MKMSQESSLEKVTLEVTPEEDTFSRNEAGNSPADSPVVYSPNFVVIARLERQRADVYG
jgi:hypothetical protein